MKQYSLSGGPWEQVYDGEGRLLRVEQAGGTKMVEYDYDAEGRRVRRVTGAVTTYFAYDAGGQLMGEYGGPVAAPSRQYLVADHLGSTRIVVSGGVCVNRFDYAPFGGEVDRAGEPCYGSSAEPRQKSTGKERDPETGLDYFGARYFSGAQGRFTSPDPKLFSARKIANPQKWNRYSYVLNNPLAAVDPDGREEVWVTIHAFIPQKSFRYMGMTWRGDNRGFSNQANASSRVQGRILIETDRSVRENPIVRTERPTSSGSQVTILGRDIQATETPKWGAVSGRRDAEGNAIVSASISGSDPLVPLAAAARANVTITIDPAASQGQVSGSITQYPAFEILAQPQGQGTVPLFQYMPPSNLDSPTTLLENSMMGPMRITSQPVPLRPSGQPDCERTNSCGSSQPQ